MASKQPTALTIGFDFANSLLESCGGDYSDFGALLHAMFQYGEEHKRGVEGILDELTPLLPSIHVGYLSNNTNAISCLTVEECKGLEFDAALVVTNEMSVNEKYIAYTRALDHLILTSSKNAVFSGDDNIIVMLTSREKYALCVIEVLKERPAFEIRSKARIGCSFNPIHKPKSRFMDLPSIRSVIHLQSL